MGIDVGGTFTDFVFVNEGVVEEYKISTSAKDPSIAVLQGLRELCELTNVFPSLVDDVFHATTTATNMVLEHKGSKTGMITTEGYRDIIHIGRHKRPFNFSIMQDIPWQKHPLVERKNRHTVKERIIPPEGEVLHPLDKNAVREAVRKMKLDGIEAIAVCFLYSFLNPAHEQGVKEIILEEYPEAYISLSSEVIPEFREYERFTTTALNAYIGPKVAGYIANLADSMAAEGMKAKLHLMQSAGGVATAEGASTRPVHLVMSGPVGGVMGATWCARCAGHENILTLDVGGTSADIAVLRGLESRKKHLLDTKIGEYAAMVPMLDIRTIGAGGGSVAYVDEGGFFRVGPRSAGAEPGPAGYDRGGEEPTVTDANLVLGRLGTELLGGRMPTRPDLAWKAIEENLQPKLPGKNVEECALGVLEIVNHNMIQAIEQETVRHGLDPREFSLFAFGGAGPLHACEIAQVLGMKTVIIPFVPGTLSALGLVVTDLKYEFSRTELQMSTTPDLAKLDRDYIDLESEALDRLTKDGVPADSMVLHRLADCRYAGQGYELPVPVLSGTVNVSTVNALVESFHQEHAREFTRAFYDNAVEIVNIRVVGVGKIAELEPTKIERGGANPSHAFKYTKDVVYLQDGCVTRLATPVYDRSKLKARNKLAGPAVVEQMDTTVLIEPGHQAVVDDYGNIIISIRPLSS